MKVKQRKFYLQLIDGRPGYFSKRDGQIVMMENSAVWRDEIGTQRLCRSLIEVQQQQAITVRNRKKWGFDAGKDRYGYAIVAIPSLKTSAATNVR